MNIVIIGVGYVGLVSGTCLAEMGHTVTCIDINQEKISNLQKGIIPIYEPGLAEMVARNLATGRLKFTCEYVPYFNHAEVCFIAVDTPMCPFGAADTSQVEIVVRTIAQHLQNYCVIVTKSTVPVGTTVRIGEIIQQQLNARNANIPFDVVSNPEFLKEGNAIQDFMKPDRIVIGTNSAQAAEMMKKVYAPFMHNYERLMVMDIASAELSKYASNAMLATRISFMNEMALLCEKVGADINFIRKSMGADDRIGHHFLYPGVGYGGSCLPKDVNALLHQGQEKEVELSILRSVHTSNVSQKKLMSKKIAHYFAREPGLYNKKIGILGLSFKPDTDDMREAPSLVLIRDLIDQKANVRLYDPIAMENAKKILGEHPLITWCKDEMDVAEEADALVLLTEWKQFRLLNFTLLLSKMRGRAFFDGRNQYNPQEMALKGFDYFSIGRQTISVQK